MTGGAIAARRAAHAWSVDLRDRAHGAVARAHAAVARASTARSRAGVLCAAAWDGRIALWCAREDRSAARRLAGVRSGLIASRRAPSGVVRRWGRQAAVAAEAAPEPRGPAHGAPATRWATARVLGERRIPSGAVGFSASFTVRELDTRELDGAQGPRCLVFENHEIVRRVWRYPPAWTTLPDADLLALAGFGP